MPHIPTIISKIIPDPTSNKGKMFLAGGDHDNLLVGHVFCLGENCYGVPTLPTISVRVKSLNVQGDKDFRSVKDIIIYPFSIFFDQFI